MHIALKLWKFDRSVFGGVIAPFDCFIKKNSGMMERDPDSVSVPKIAYFFPVNIHMMDIIK